MSAPAPTNKYSQGKIYKVIAPDGRIYVGSTCDVLDVRLNSHRKHSKYSTTTSSIYTLMRELGADTFTIELVEAYPCETEDQLRMREEHWRKELEATLNDNRCYVSDEEEKREAAERTRKWYNDNRAKALASKKEYYVTNKEDLDAYKKEWYLTNKDRVLIKRKEAYIANKESKRFYCEVCDHTFGSNQGLTKHLATNKHALKAQTVAK